MSADLESTHTLSELLEWLQLRVRWLRDWHRAPQNPKPIPSPFRDTIVSMFRASLYPPPSDPSKIQSWANEHIWKFSEHTIYEVHRWLETHRVFGAPAWSSPDPLVDERILVTSLNHLSHLLDFVGCRVGEQPPLADRVQAMRQECLNARDIAERVQAIGEKGDWQEMIDELWRRWRWHFPDEHIPPKRPAVRDGMEVADAADLLLRELERWLKENIEEAASGRVEKNVPMKRADADRAKAETSTPPIVEKSEGGAPPADPGKPSKDRQNDILAAIQAKGTPLTRPELVEAMRLRTEGKLGHQLAWMVTNNILVNIPPRGYWPADKTVPE